jgi:hypothetical protein
VTITLPNGEFGIILDANTTPDVSGGHGPPEQETETVEETVVVQGTTKEDVLTQIPPSVNPVVTEETLEGGHKVCELMKNRSPNYPLWLLIDLY